MSYELFIGLLLTLDDIESSMAKLAGYTVYMKYNYTTYYLSDGPSWLLLGCHFGIPSCAVCSINLVSRTLWTNSRSNEFATVVDTSSVLRVSVRAFCYFIVKEYFAKNEGKLA